MNADIASKIKLVSNELAALRKENPQAFLSLLKVIRNAARELSDEFQALKTK